MAIVSQMTLSNAFSWMKMLEFRLRFHWSLFLRVQLTIIQHWFRQWLGAGQATSHYLNQWLLVYWRIYASLGLNELMTFNQKRGCHVVRPDVVFILFLQWHSPERDRVTLNGVELTLLIVSIKWHSTERRDHVSWHSVVGVFFFNPNHICDLVIQLWCANQVLE